MSMSFTSSLPQKRPSTDAATSSTSAGSSSSSSSKNTRYNRLLSILTKCLNQSKEKVAGDAPSTIQESYGGMTSLFTSSEDSNGVSSLVDLLLEKLDSVHDRFTGERAFGATMTRLEQLLQKQDVKALLSKLETSVNEVEEEERQFNEEDEADKSSARNAIKAVRSTRLSPSGKKRRVLPSESIGYHAHRLKLEYQSTLQNELDEVMAENDKLEGELKSKWEEWQSHLDDVEGALTILKKLGEIANEEEI